MCNYIIYIMSEINISKNSCILDSDEEIDELSQKLLSLLNNADVDHNIIMTKQNIKDAHLYCKINNIIGQSSGPLIQNYIINKYNMIRNNASNINGDCSLNNKNIEIKVSLGGKTHKKFNYVQIRPNHNVDYYLLTAYYLDKNNYKNKGELFIFLVDKVTMMDIILHYGSYAHGTIKELGEITLESLKDVESNKEYCIRPTYGDKCWNKLLESRVETISIKSDQLTSAN